MRLDKFTIKAQDAIQEAQQFAASKGTPAGRFFTSSCQPASAATGSSGSYYEKTGGE